MNQILYTGEQKKGPASIKSILRFFSIFVIIFGAIFIAKGSYSLYQNSKQVIDDVLPTIAFDQNQNNAIVTVSHANGLSKVKYYWEGETETIKQANSKTTVVLDNIEIPSGKNTLHVTAIDQNGKVVTNTHEYSYDGIAIELALINNSIKINASDLKGLSYIKYKWNSDKEITAMPTGDDNTIIEEITDIPSGRNTLYVTAVNIDNETITKTLEISGNRPSEIKIYIQGDDLIVFAYDEEGIDKIIQRINDGEDQVIEVNESNQYNYRYSIAGSENVMVKITIVDVDGRRVTFNATSF